MRDHLETLLRVICLVLAACLLVAVARRVLHHDPLTNLHIPALPILTTASDTGTNAAAAKDSGKAATNAAGIPGAKTTSGAAEKSGATTATNAAGGSNALVTGSKTNRAPVLAMTGTNASRGLETATVGSNLVVQSEAAKTSTNLARPAEMANQGCGDARPGPGMGGVPRPGVGMTPLSELPPAIKARVDRITESEILGQVMRPLPMALLGIAGETAFLRSPNGGTGLVKEGSELGGLKLLRIGINRVLVEQDGEKKELMIFNGLGGESLLPK